MSDPVIEVPETAVESGERIARNSVLRSVGYVGGALLQFAAVVLAARYLGVAGFGNYTFIMAVAGVFQLLADMGVRNVVVRDLAVDPGSLKERLSIARTLLVIMSIVSLAGIVAAAYAMPVSTEVRDSLCIAGVAVLATFFGLGYSAVLRAQDRMASDILGFALHKLVMLAAMAVVVRTAWGLRGVFAAVLLANFVLFLYFRILVARSHGVTRLSRDLPAAWRLLRESFPLGVGEVLRRLTWQVDRLLLTAMGGPIAVGLFSIAYKFIEAMKPLADNMVLPLFPGFSRLARRSTSELFALHARGLKILYVLGCPAAYVLLTLSHRILKLFFGAAYLPASAALEILAPVPLLLLATSIYRYLFTGLGHLRTYTACVGISLLVNVALDLALIPRLGFRGAAIASVASEFALFIAGIVVIGRLGGGLASLGLLWRPLIAGAGFGAVCYVVRDQPLPVVALGGLFGLIVYVILLGVLGTFSRRELALVAGTFRLRPVQES